MGEAMSIVTLVSGGLDSTLMAVFVREEGINQHPLFIDYGQLCVRQEWSACTHTLRRLQLPRPVRMNLSGYGAKIRSGLTTATLRTNEDAFLPGRNALFLLAGYSYACDQGASAVAIGLLSEETHLFPDQTSEFIRRAEDFLGFATGRSVRITAPLMGLSKPEVILLAKEHGLSGTYSCHAGTVPPCGSCISCREYLPQDAPLERLSSANR